MMQHAGVGAATRCPTLFNRCLQIDVKPRPELRGDLIAVIWMHRRVLVPVKNNRRYRARTPTSTRSAARPVPRRELALAHRRKRGGNVAGRPAGQAGMHANRGVEVGVGYRQNSRGRSAGREPGGVNPIRVDRVVAHDLAVDAGDQRGLALASFLITRTEPVPTLEALAEAAWAG
jgi:hypothetical protein